MRRAACALVLALHILTQRATRREIMCSAACVKLNDRSEHARWVYDATEEATAPNIQALHCKLHNSARAALRAWRVTHLIKPAASTPFAFARAVLDSLPVFADSTVASDAAESCFS